MIDIVINSLKDLCRQKRLILFFWLLNLAISTVFLAPYFQKFEQFFSHRLVLDLLARENVYTYFAEFFYWTGKPLDNAFSFLRVGGLIHLLITYLLSGGAIAAIHRGRYSGMGVFIRECLRFLPPIAKSAVFAMGVSFFAVLFAFIIGLPFSFFLPDPFVESRYFYFFAGWIALIAVGLFVALMMIDLVRVQIIRLNTGSVFPALKAGLKLLKGNYTSVFFSYLLLFLLSFLTIIVHRLLQGFLAETSLVYIIFQFSLLQISIILLVWIKLSRFALLLRYLGISETGEISADRYAEQHNTE